MAKKKAGKRKVPCAAYAASNRRERNKVRKLQKHLKEFPQDAVALAAVEVAKKAIKGY